MGILSALGELRRSCRRAAQLGGKSTLTQLREISRLRLQAPHLGPSEYFAYGLWRPSHTPDSQRRFVGWRKQREIQNAVRCDYTLDDKLRLYAILSGVGLPIPRIYGVYSPQGRPFDGAAQLRTDADVAAFLERNADTPMFSKPARSDYGIGGLGIRAYDKDKRELRLIDGSAQSLAAFVGSLGSYERSAAEGHIFQELLETPTAMRPVFGTTVMTTRFVVGLESSGPTVLRVLLKIPVGKNMHDNFHAGESGNCVAQVDVDSGEIRAVVSGVGFDRKEIVRHPETGATMVGCVVANWKDTVELVKEAARAFPTNLLQHWDVAIGSEGPVLVEINSEGDFDLHQYCWGQGMLTDSLERLLERALT